MISNTDPTVDSVLDDLVDEIVAQLQNGSDVDIDRMAAENPQVGDQLRKLHSTLNALVCLNHSLDDDLAGGLDLSESETRTLGDFRIVRQLGRGGMGVVYEARQLSINRAVALKILPFAALVDSKALQRFRNEVAAIATLEHPHIVSVFAVGEERGVHFYAMQLVRGQSLAVVIRELRSRIDQNGSLTGDAISQVVSEMAEAADSTAELPAPETRDDAREDEFPDTRAQRESATRSSNITDQTYFRNIIRLILQSAEALQHAHDHGIIHRDIKPGNLLLDVQGSLFVTDFGLARIETEAGMTITGDVLGTLRYMSPEQVLANRVAVDHRTDVYSLGATLYELLTLRPMWVGNDKPEIIRKISFEEPPKMRRINSAIPIDLETIVLKAISKNPNDRYDSASSFAGDLQAFLDHKPIVARRTTILKHVSKWAYRQRRVLAIAASAALLALSIGLVLTWNAWKSESVQRSRAQNNYRMALGTLDELVNNAAEHERMIDLEGWRRQTLEKAINNYTRFAEQNSSDPDSALLLRVQDKLAKVHLLLENYSPAAEAAEAGIEIARQLDAASASYSVRKTLGTLWRRLGKSRQELGQTTEASAAWEEAHTVFANLPAVEDADNPRSLLDVAEFLWFYAEWHMKEGNPREAIQSLLRAVSMAELAANQDPENQTVQLLLCEIRDDLGDNYRRGNNRELSLNHHQKAVATARELDHSRRNLQVKARCFCNLGKRVVEHPKTNDEAEQLFRDALGIYQKLTEDYPWDIYYRGDLAACQHNLAVSLRYKGESDEALKLLKQAQTNQSYAVRHKSQNSDYQLFWAKHKALRGQIAEELKQHDEALNLYEESLERLEQLHQRWPDHRRIQTYLVNIYHQRCRMLTNAPDAFGNESILKRAESDAVNSLKILQKLKAAFPDFGDARPEVAELDFYSRSFHETYTILARIYSGWQRYDDAVIAIENARRYLDRLDDQQTPKVRYEIGETIVDMASIYSMADRDPVMVEEMVRDGLARMEKAYADDPRVANTRENHVTELHHAWFNLALALYDQGKYPESKQQWEKAIKLDAESLKGFSRLVHLYMEYMVYCPDKSFRDYRRAIEVGKTVLEIAGDDQELIHFGQRDTGVAHYRLGEFAEANRIYSDIMTNGRFSTILGYYMAMTLACLEDEDDVGPFFRKDAWIAFYLTEDKVSRSGTPLNEEMQALRKEAIEVVGIDRSSEIGILTDQARACHQAGIHQSAITYWRLLTEKQPEMAEAWESLGVALLASDQTKEAIDVLEHATSLTDPVASAFFHLGCACAASGQSDKAFAALTRSIDLGFGSAEQLKENAHLQSLVEDEQFEKLLQSICERDKSL